MITRACRLSAAMIMTVPISPGPKCGRQSLKPPGSIAMQARMKLLPARRPHTKPRLVQWLCRWRAATSVLGVESRAAPVSSAMQTVQRETHATRSKCRPRKCWPNTLGSFERLQMFTVTSSSSRAVSMDQVMSFGLQLSVARSCRGCVRDFSGCQAAEGRTARRPAKCRALRIATLLDIDPCEQQILAQTPPPIRPCDPQLRCPLPRASTSAHGE